MRVSEIKTDASEILGFCSDKTLYSRLTQAVEVLSKEGPWDSLQAYIDIIVDDRVVTLPRDVLMPIKININNNPAFSRSKLYEFSLNGPGNDMQDTIGFSWMDKGTVPVMKQPGGKAIAASAYNEADIGLSIKIWGYNVQGRECNDTIIIGGADPDQLVSSPNIYQVITKVMKPITLGRVDLYGVRPSLTPPPVPPPPGGPPPPVKCANPVLSPAGGTFQGRQPIQISDTEPGASLSFTIDGSIPTPDHGRIVDSGFRYIPQYGDTTLSVIAFKEGLENSDVVTGIYHIIDPQNTVPPTFDPQGGTFEDRVIVRLNAPGADHIAYTINDPVPPSPTHGTQTPQNYAFVAFSRAGTYVLRAMAYTQGRNGSAVVVQTYVITNGRDFGAAYEDLGQNPLKDSDSGVIVETPTSIPVPAPPTPFPIVPQPPIVQGGPDYFVLLTSYYADETEPAYRQILLNAVVPGTDITPRAIRMLYRRRTYAITSDEDWIPLTSHMAVLTMLRALESLRVGSTEELQKVGPLMKQAVDFLTKEQQVLDNFNMAAQSEIPSTLDLGYTTADSLIVADIYDDACQIFGPVGRDFIFDLITDAIELLNNHGQWDGLVGSVDLLTDAHYYITLPRYVESPIAINVNGQPRSMRNKWFEYHLNGPGSQMRSCTHWDDAGDVVTIRPIPWPSKLIARCDLQSDNGKVIKVFGWDYCGRYIRTNNSVGVEGDGITIRMSQDGIVPGSNIPLVARIDRVTKQQTNGYCQLMAWEPNTKTAVPIGFYHPDEMEPNYRRIKLGQKCAWVRMKYRKRQIKVTGLTDQLNLRSKLAVILAMKAVKAMDTDINQAKAYEDKAVELLDKEQSSRNPAETFDIQFEGLDTAEVII